MKNRSVYHILTWAVHAYQVAEKNQQQQQQQH